MRTVKILLLMILSGLILADSRDVATELAIQRLDQLRGTPDDLDIIAEVSRLRTEIQSEIVNQRILEFVATASLYHQRPDVYERVAPLLVNQAEIQQRLHRRCDGCSGRGNLPQNCHNCRGSGRCVHCEGRGFLLLGGGFDRRPTRAPCTACNAKGLCTICGGRGRGPSARCRSCKGKGSVVNQGEVVKFYNHTLESLKNELKNSIIFGEFNQLEGNPLLIENTNGRELNENASVAEKQIRNNSSTFARLELDAEREMEPVREWVAQARRERTGLNNYTRAAANGTPKEQFELAVGYLEGENVPRDAFIASRLFMVSADNNYAPAQHNLGLMYLEGRGVVQNDGLSVYWFRKAARQNFAESLFNLGYMYEKGRGVAQSDHLAFQSYELSAKQGYLPAMISVGLFYDSGKGVQQNGEQASSWLNKAFKEGGAEVAYSIGVLYYEGEGGARKDWGKARMWIRKAAIRGHGEAQQAINLMDRGFM